MTAIRTSRAPQPNTARLLSIEEARHQLGGTARSRLYALIAERRVKTVKLGRRRFVVASSIDELIRRSAV